ncbi:MAG: hypothetical protein ACOYNL_03865 [Rickettsiales bacterium]
MNNPATQQGIATPTTYVIDGMTAEALQKRLEAITPNTWTQILKDQAVANPGIPR